MKIFRHAALLILVAAPAGAQTTMDSLWPNGDLSSWSYVQHQDEFAPVPAMNDNQIRLRLDGEVLAAGGVTAQYLRHEVIAGAARAAGDASLPNDPLLRRLWIARPDLRSRIAASLDAAACPEFGPPGFFTVLLNGELAFRKTADEIAAWRCNLDNTRSWQWLSSDVAIGGGFTLQLIPDIANDVFLHGTVGAIETSTVPGGVFPGCVRVDYVVDYGTAECTDTGGNPLGTYHGETRGAVWYAPGVGPVECVDEFIPYVSATGSCVAPSEIGRVYARTTVRLSSSTVAARPTSWGRLKLTYR